GRAGGLVVVDSAAPALDQPVATQGIEAGGFGVENDFAHGIKEPPRAKQPEQTNQDRRGVILAASVRMSRIRARTGSRPCEVSTTKCARCLFSASGICRARMASSFSAVILGRARMRSRWTSGLVVTPTTAST